MFLAGTLLPGCGATGLVGGTVANTATIVRFFQTRGLAASIAVSSGVLVSVSGFFVQAVLFAFAWVTTASESPAADNAARAVSGASCRCSIAGSATAAAGAGSTGDARHRARSR